MVKSEVQLAEPLNICNKFSLKGHMHNLPWVGKPRDAVTKQDPQGSWFKIVALCSQQQSCPFLLVYYQVQMSKQGWCTFKTSQFEGR